MFAKLRIDLLLHVGIVFQELAGVFAALADALAFISVPGAAFFDDILRGSQVQQVPFLGNTFAINDV